jgi:diguanylate cyclase (GGDEF)-like protein
MAAALSRLRESRSWWFDLIVFFAGVLTFGLSLTYVEPHDWQHTLTVLAGVPLIVLVARFPMVLDDGRHGIEVGFDSTILIFLLCTIEVPDALAVWSLGVIITQVTTGKRLGSKLFNIGVGILAGGLAAWVLDLFRGDELGTPRELVAVALAAACYFATDFVLSAVSVAIAANTPVRSQLLQPGTVFAVACFVPFDTLGYLAAIVYRATPWWMLSLLAVPVVTLLVATRALTRGRENARRLSVLFDAAVRAQTVQGPDELVAALLDDARELVRLSDVPLRAEPPGSGEIGAELRRGREVHWIVAQATDRARSTVNADEQALKALAAVASEGFARLELTAEKVHVARHDPLTDLPNRGILLDRLTRALVVARRRRTRVALMFLDLDGFKPVNDRFGHATGDAVLIELAQRLRESVRESDTLARLGGDEFAILVEDAGEAEIDSLCARLVGAVSAGVTVAGQQVPLGASVGVAFSRGDVSAEDLLRRADLAMYEAKAQGKGRCVRYQSSIGRARLQRLELVEDLRQALADEEIAVVYQPVVEVPTGRIIGAEALARWHRDGTPVPPDLFVSVAEETGQIIRLGDQVLDQVVRDAAAVREVTGDDFMLGVNVSARQLRDAGFVPAVQRAVAAMEGIGLLLEITEREGVNADPVVLDAMRRVDDLGVRLAIDDFGVGFSSVGYLHSLPAQVIKLDASLTRDIDVDDRAAALLHSVTLMVRSLGLDVVVEGIERQSQLDRICSDEQVVAAQGYLLHRPMPLAELLEVLQQPTCSASRAAGEPSRPALATRR